ncbi:hypothetical protein FN846DRAFT_903388 [Sphaerosporella brunnea]|uniref:Uncharacterized protein n=1 Tax=Sphaerosporella brunnea TaxID=1250544 RepID=A0A5J5F7Z2_9PEZI|nr:hypothetical protein FN846DRAFT_903388 [Sphaerosporella brunnea]
MKKMDEKLGAQARRDKAATRKLAAKRALTAANPSVDAPEMGFAPMRQTWGPQLARHAQIPKRRRSWSLNLAPSKCALRPTLAASTEIGVRGGRWLLVGEVPPIASPLLVALIPSVPPSLAPEQLTLLPRTASPPLQLPTSPSPWVLRPLPPATSMLPPARLPFPPPLSLVVSLSWPVLVLLSPGVSWPPGVQCSSLWPFQHAQARAASGSRTKVADDLTAVQSQHR